MVIWGELKKLVLCRLQLPQSSATMSISEYAELHCHSAFSFLDGASHPEELVVCAKELGLKALALTDHDDLGGIVRFSYAAKEISLDAIVGAELSMEDGSHLIVLAKDLTGYKNLCYLITQSRSDCTRGSPRVLYDNLFERASGLVALSGCPCGRIPTELARGDTDAALMYARNMLDGFGEDFYLEIWNHNIAQELVIGRRMLEIAKTLSIPYVATNNVHYATAEKRIVHDVLTCLRHEVTLAAAGRKLRPNGSWFLKSPQEMSQMFSQYPEAIKNTLVVAEKCQFRLGLLKPPLPTFELPPEHELSSLPNNELLSKLVWDGAAKRYPDLTEQHVKQINHELDLIFRLQLAPYFLIMWDIVRFALSRGIAVQGRGSAANSAVCYCLLITAVDPIGMDLLFERFLSEGRNEPPDIDLDIAHQERETVLQYVYERYGRKHAAMVCEVITYRGRSAVRDAARVLGFSQDQADRLSAEAARWEAADAARSLLEGGAQRAGLDLKDKRVQLLIRVVFGLHQLPRHRSIHVGGFVLCGELLGESVPVEPAAMEGRTVIQWDKDDIDLAGMIKIDLLGLGMLQMIQEALKLVKQYRGVQLDIGRLDMFDKNIYEMLQRADTVGVFQVESRAQMNILPKLKPTCFYDIIVSIAIVRPGPIQGNIIHPYLRRRRGDEPVIYLHPSLEPILKRTLGVPLFQEQGMKLAVVAAGFSPSQADQLRRVMSHKRSLERMAKLCDELAVGMRANNFAEEAIATITHQLRAFANYGFPESHAASFSLLVYASAYLKRYYAPEFYCAMLNAQPMGFYSPATLVNDAVRHGVVVRPVDLAHSSWHCTLEDDTTSEVSSVGPALRIGLRYVRGFGPKSRKNLEKAWELGGTFKSLDDVLQRSGLDASELKVLARAGAFETLFPGRREALWKILDELRPKIPTPLLDALLLNAGPAQMEKARPEMREMSPMETVISDYKLLGLTVNDHPMVFYRKWAQERNVFACDDLKLGEHGTIVKVAGGAICRQRPETAKGFVFMTLEDETGMANVIIKPQVFESYHKVIMKSSFLCVKGKLQLEEGVSNLIAEHFEALPPLPSDTQVHVPARNFH